MAWPRQSKHARREVTASRVSKEARMLQQPSLLHHQFRYPGGKAAPMANSNSRLVPKPVTRTDAIEQHCTLYSNRERQAALPEAPSCPYLRCCCTPDVSLSRTSCVASLQPKPGISGLMHPRTCAARYVWLEFQRIIHLQLEQSHQSDDDKNLYAATYSN